MSVRITDSTTVALYDSTEGIAFGPTFGSDDEAISYVLWIEHQGLSVRKLTVFEHKQQHGRWAKAKMDEETGMLTESAYSEVLAVREVL